MAKVTVSIPDELLAQIDAEAARRATSRSALLAVAARNELRRPDSAALRDAIARSEERFLHAGRFEAADVVRIERNAPVTALALTARPCGVP